MAANQAPTSAVAIDTNQLAEPQSHGGYPLYWSNIPSEANPIALKYSSNASGDCFASTPERNVVCLVSSTDVFVYEQSSGAVLHQVNLVKEAGAVYLSTDGQTFWIGDSGGGISVRNVETGREECTIEIADIENTDDFVIWMRDVGEYVASGTGLPTPICWNDHKTESTIALIDKETKTKVKEWSTKLPCYCYCFHANEKIIFSGHQNIIKGWNLSGDLVKELPDAGPCVFSLCAHPFEDMIVSGSKDFVIKQWDITSTEVKATINDPAGSGWGFGGNWAILYDHSGERILTTTPNCQSIRIYTLDGQMQTELKGHSKLINRMCLVPGSNQVVTVGRDGSMLFNLPAASDVFSAEGIVEQVCACSFLIGAEEFVTVSKDALRIWRTCDSEPRVSVDIDIAEEAFEVGGMVIHPNGKYICVAGSTDVVWYDTDNLEEISRYKALYESQHVDEAKDEHIEDDGRITCMKISPNGEKLLIGECRNYDSKDSKAYVFDNEDLTVRSQPVRYSYGARIFSCDIHADNVQAVCGGHAGMHLWNMWTGEQIKVINDIGCFFVYFIPGFSDMVLHDDGEKLFVCNLVGERQKEFLGHTNTVTESQLVQQDGNQHLITSSDDGTIRIWDFETAKCLYVFSDDRAQNMNCMAVHPSNELVIGGNENSLLYILKTKRD